MGLIICERVILFFLALMIFFLPISKAVIEVSASICIVFWVIRLFLILRKEGKRCLWNKFTHFIKNLSFLDKALIVFVLGSLLSVVFSANVKLSVETFFLKWLEYILIFIITRDMVNSKFRFSIFIWIVLASLLFMGIDGVFQIITGYDIFRHRGMFSGCRVNASFINPNDFGSYLITVLPLTLALFFSGVSKNLKVVLSVMFFIIVSLLLLTFSKSAILAFLAAVVFLGLYTKKRYILFYFIITAILVLVLPLAFKIPLDFTKRILSFASDGGAIDRKYLWAAAWRMFMHFPVFGVGLGTFMQNYQKFWLRPTTEISYAHNCYLQILAETGIIGLAAFLSFLFIWFRNTLTALFKPSKSFYYFSFVGLSTGLIAYLLNSFVDTNFYSLPIATLFWFILGLQQAGARLISDESQR
ncbi:MAG: O-antigen ligase family protein [Candidatus Omnitrophota bacterium]